MTLKSKLRKATEANDTEAVARLTERLKLRNQRWQVARGWLKLAVTTAISFFAAPAVKLGGTALGMNQDRINHQIEKLKSGDMFNKSWKTTSAGIVAITGGITRLVFAIKAHNITEEAITTSVTAIITGIGLLFARDNNVTSEQAGACPDANK